jgi:predicted signal transduction protein with EAL and GGDEF domain
VLLSHLKSLPVDAPTIGAGFVRDLGTSPGDLAIVRSIVALAKAFKLQVVAEGGGDTRCRADVDAAWMSPGAGILVVTSDREQRHLAQHGLARNSPLHTPYGYLPSC